MTNTAGQATIAWTAPATNGGSALTGYTVTSSPALAAPAACSTSLTGASTNCVFTGLVSGTAYTFTVTAKNVNGDGQTSNPSNSVIGGRPGAPTIGTATASTSTAGRVTVTWTIPTGNGGSAITNYIVTPYLNGTTAQATQSFAGAATATGTLNGLTSTANYTFTVSAVNANGTGPASAASNSVTVR